MNSELIRIATRQSPLALWQAEHVAACLRTAHPGIETQLVRMTTRGDQLLDAPLAKVGGKGLFVKELEQGLLEDRADIAVHSMKDVPIEFPEGLHLAAILPREDPRDALVSTRYSSFHELPDNARIGTSSLRRQCQIKSLLPKCEILSLRGNVNTRLSKLDAGEFDAIILAGAGLIRLGLQERITEALAIELCLPAIGQGAIGIECGIDNPRINRLLQPLNDPNTALPVSAERAMNLRLQGGCQVPIAGHAQLKAGIILLQGLVGSPDGRTIIRGSFSATADQAEALGAKLADYLLEQGAEDILKAVSI